MRSICQRTACTQVRLAYGAALLLANMLIACREECPRGQADDGERCVAVYDEHVGGKGAAEGGGVGGAQGAAGRADVVGPGVPAAAMTPGAISGVNVIVNLGVAGASPQPLAAGALANASPGVAAAGMVGSPSAGAVAARSGGSGASGVAATMTMIPMAGRPPVAGMGAAGMVMTPMAGRPAAGTGAMQKPVTPTNPPQTASKCGNGVIDTGEKCDPMSKSSPCPTAATCKADNECTTAVISGTGCQAICTKTKKTDCPAKQPATTCGDGMVTGTEKCDPKSATKCPTSCVDDDPRTDDKLEGSADSRSAWCPRIRKSDCGTNPKAESPVSCGDGMVGPGEVCDPQSKTPCPTSCPKKDGCHIEKLEGNGCMVMCKAAEITDTIAGDKCCPRGATLSTDSDCKPKCGDGVVTAPEKCDPMSSDQSCPNAVACEDHDPCTIDGVVGSAASCAAECLYTPIGGCVSGCGNGIVELDEECDHAAEGEERGMTCDINCHKIKELVPCTVEEDCWEPAPGTICISGYCVATRF